MAELRLEQVSKHYIEDRHSVYALKDISLTIEQGEFVFLIGSSGAGKTTLLKLMSGELAGRSPPLGQCIAWIKSDGHSVMG